MFPLDGGGPETPSRDKGWRRMGKGCSLPAGGNPLQMHRLKRPWSRYLVTACSSI